MWLHGRWWGQARHSSGRQEGSGFSSERNGSISGLNREVTCLHLCLKMISLAAALRILQWYWICTMLSALPWVNRLTIWGIKNLACSGPRPWGTLESSVRFPAALWIHWLLFSSVVNPTLKGRWTLSTAEAHPVPRSCWRGFTAAGGTWPGFEFYLFWEDLAVSTNRLHTLNVYFRKWRYVAHSSCMLVYWTVIHGFISFHKVIFRLEIWTQKCTFSLQNTECIA